MKIKQNVDHHKRKRQGQGQGQQGQQQGQRHLLYPGHHKRSAAAFGLGTSSVVSFVVAMNRENVVGLVVDLLDLDLDVDLVDVALDADLKNWKINKLAIDCNFRCAVLSGGGRGREVLEE